MYLVVGLGNPGGRYQRNRHNVGFMVVERLAERHGARLRRSWRVHAELAEIRLGGERVWLCRPRTYMNRSGLAVAALMRRTGARVGDLVVVLDDVDLPPGRIRVRRRGGAGGHRGLVSVIEALGSEEFTRVRVGIGRPPPGGDLVDYVLSDFGPEERPVMKAAVERAAEAVETIVRDGVEAAMNRYNAEPVSGG